MLEWKWNNGTLCEKSPRIIKKREETTGTRREPSVNINESTVSATEMNEIAAAVYQNPDLSSVPKESVLNENQAYLQSLEMDQGFRAASTKREESWEKMASRDMIGQMGQNPFFYQEGKTNSYVNDLTALNQFMQPTRETSSGLD
jgi:hypothetical protein